MVGSTAAAEAADPEDVQARIRAFHDILRRQIEAFGGTVEKFAGDAVLAVFGAPVAHEDDAERAVRAGLAIVAAVASRAPATAPNGSVSGSVSRPVRWSSLREEAFALLGAGRTGTAGDRGDPTAALLGARDLFDRLGMRLRVAECEALVP